MAKLHFFYSTMNAGKSTALLQTHHNFEENNLKSLLFLPNTNSNDDSSINKIKSRIGIEKDAIYANQDFNFITYIEENNLISLKGTLVPATTINRSIASIPLIGDLLIGKKVGEGVFGVSFKVKGPPKKLETTVNPIKTLTPRFITRTLEKIKKN